MLWQEYIAPLLVLEFVSGSGAEERDRTPCTGKFWIYEQVIRPAFYGIYEVTKASVEIYHLMEGQYYLLPANDRGHYPITPMGAVLGIWQGQYLDLELPWLHWWDDRGNLLLNGQKQAALAEVRTEQAERQLAQAENQLEQTENQLEQKHRRAERLAALRRAQGIEPDYDALGYLPVLNVPMPLDFTSLDFTNTNLVWTSILAETLFRLGLTTAIVCPGSRSAPLAIAFANHPHIEAIPVLDERSASFFALGLARQSHRPVVLICTSGTAGANFYPAVIEATESGVPLMILTADRPPELRDCNAGQAIDQHKLYGTFPNWQTELAIPSLELPLLAYLRQTLIHTWERAFYPAPGVVHLNLPFRDPLAPIPQPHAQAIASTFNTEAFFAAVISIQESEGRRQEAGFDVSAQPNVGRRQEASGGRSLHNTPHPTPHTPHGIIIAGTAQPEAPEAYCRAIAQLSQTLGYPVLAEGLSPLRNYAALNPNLITTYDLILRNPALAEKLAPETVIRVGGMPTSKQLRAWLNQTQPRQWIIDPDGRNLDPLHGNTTHVRLSIAAFLQTLPQPPQLPQSPSPYLDRWRTVETQVRQRVDQTMHETNALFEGKAAWLLSQVLPAGTPLFINSSMPVRDVEWFWAPGNSRVQPFFNRGANGIDGTLSTALGIAHRQQSSVMLTGDLALLHDTNGFLLRQHFVGHLTIVLINNNGGGIFEMLPIAQNNPSFESFFATPQAIDFAKLGATYAVEHEHITTWQQLEERLNPLPTEGIRVLELRTDRKADAQWRQSYLGTFAAKISI